jgi:hypothetical protein
VGGCEKACLGIREGVARLASLHRFAAKSLILASLTHRLAPMAPVRSTVLLVDSKKVALCGLGAMLHRVLACTMAEERRDARGRVDLEAKLRDSIMRR